MKKLNKHIAIISEKPIIHSKASEKYLSVKFTYGKNQFWEGWVPIEYRRTGISLSSQENITEYLNDIYEQMRPENKRNWIKEQEKFWNEEKPRAIVTKSFFDKLAEGGWKCVNCDLPPNPNSQRRIQDIKEFGYTIATDTARHCPHCGTNKTHLILLPIKRGSQKGNGYETIPSELRKRIIKLLNNIDCYDAVYNAHCLPDHKFSEIRWDDNTKAQNNENMSDEEIIQKFQLLTNQRNQHKREICRNCYQTGKRGTIFGIPFFYEGNENWDETIPRIGKEAEKGCIGCAWYDIEKWRQEVLKILLEKDNEKNSR